MQMHHLQYDLPKRKRIAATVPASFIQHVLRGSYYWAQASRCTLTADAAGVADAGEPGSKPPVVMSRFGSLGYILFIHSAIKVMARLWRASERARRRHDSRDTTRDLVMSPWMSFSFIAQLTKPFLFV